MAENDNTTCIASVALLFIIILIFIYLNYFAAFQPDNKENPYGPDHFNKGNAFGRSKIFSTINNEFTMGL